MRLAVDFRRNLQLRWLLCAALLVIVAIPAVGWIFQPSLATGNDIASTGKNSVGSLPITAPGRVLPKDGVIIIAAPASAETGPAIITAMLARQGDWVKQGQTLATLRGRTELEAALNGRQRKVDIARARLDALKSGGKEDDLKALRAEVLSAEATLARVEAETRRSKQLREKGLLSDADVETQESRLAVASRTLDTRRARLSGLSSVRPADLAVAQAELRSAEADVDELNAKLESTIVRAPFEGRVLAVYVQPGQSVGLEGVLAFGRTSEMYVDAEVLEEDLARTRPGMKAHITGDMFEGVVTGTVEEIGYLVGSREVFRNDPTAFADSRVVHVKIRAHEPAVLARYINARVTAVIGNEPG